MAKGKKIAEHVFNREGVQVTVPIKMVTSQHGRTTFEAKHEEYGLSIDDTDIDRLKGRIDEALVKVLGINLEVNILIRIGSKEPEGTYVGQEVSFCPTLVLLGVVDGKRKHALIKPEDVDDNCVWRGVTAELCWRDGWLDSVQRLEQGDEIKTTCLLRATKDTVKAVKAFAEVLGKFVKEMHQNFSQPEVIKFLVMVLGARKSKAFDFGE
jgi:hypothetical protein